MFQSVSMIGALKMAYVVFPSVSSAKAVFNVRTTWFNSQSLGGYMSLNGKERIEVQYAANSSRNPQRAGINEEEATAT